MPFPLTTGQQDDSTSFLVRRGKKTDLKRVVIEEAAFLGNADVFLQGMSQRADLQPQVASDASHRLNARHIG